MVLQLRWLWLNSRALNCDFRGYKCKSYQSPVILFKYVFTQYYVRDELHTFDDFELIYAKTISFRINEHNKIWIKQNYLPLDEGHEICGKRFYVTNGALFKNNYRYFGFVRAETSDNIFNKYYPGREITFQELKIKKLLKRVFCSLLDVILKTMFAGLNNYELINSPNVVHMMSFKPVFLYYYKIILKSIRMFLKLKEGSLKFVCLNFKTSIKKFKKLRSIKKNLKKKNLRKMQQDDYTLINF